MQTIFGQIPFKSFFITFKIGIVNLMISTISIRFLPYFLYFRLEKIRPFLTNFLEKESLKTIFLFLVNGMYNSFFFILHFSAAQIQKGLTKVSQGVMIISPGLYWFFNRESLKDLELRTRKEEALIAKTNSERALADERVRVLREQYPLRHQPEEIGPLSIIHRSLKKTKEEILPTISGKPCSPKKEAPLEYKGIGVSEDYGPKTELPSIPKESSSAGGWWGWF